MGIETAQCKCVLGGPGQRADPFDIILCHVGRALPLAHALRAGVGRRRGAGVPWERVTASPKPRKALSGGPLRRPVPRASPIPRDCNGEWCPQLTA